MKKQYNDQMNLNFLRIFDELYHCKSTKKASIRLGITQSAVSQTLAKMREYTGDRLFYTAGGMMHATEKGHHIGKELGQCIHALDQRLLMNEGDDPSHFEGGITIAVSSLFLEAIASGITTSMVFEKLPKAKFNITTWNEHTCEKIANGEIQIGLNFYPIDFPKSIRAIPMTTSKPIIVLHKNHPWSASNYNMNTFNDFPTGGIFVPKLANFNALLENQHSDRFNFQFRSESMSTLACLAEHSQTLALTENLSASMCNENLLCLHSQWLEELTPNKVSHAIYYSESNHNSTFYTYISKIIKKLLAEKIDQIEKRTLYVN